MSRSRLVRRDGKYRMVALANSSPAQGMSTGRGPSGASQSNAYLLGADLQDSMLEGIIDTNDPYRLQAIYRDIYLNDHIAGAVVDIRATAIFSDFNLTGQDDKLLQVYMDNMKRMNVHALHPEMYVDRDVSGSFVASMVYDRNINGFTDVIPLNIADIQVQPTPLFSEDPILRFTVPKHLKDFANDASTEAKRIQQKIPRVMMDAFRNAKQVDLDPLCTLYLPRTTMTGLQVGVSAYRRILHIYLLERMLYRGTLTEFSRRQRSTLHVTAGDDDWIPTENELLDLVGLFQSTEQDPISAVVATRSAVQTAEIRSGGDFFKWTDISDQLESMKLKGLGMNESILTGDATFNNLETAMSSLIEDMRSTRERLTDGMYYSKLFPLIAQLNDFVEPDRKATASRKSSYMTDLQAHLNNDSNYKMPQIMWHKTLRPDANRDYLDILTTLEEKGVPVSLRVWAAAGAIDLDKAIEDAEADTLMRKKIKEITGKTPGEEDEYASASMASANWLNRDFGETAEVHDRTATGKKKYVYNQRARNRKINENIARALDALAQGNRYEEVVASNK